MSDGQHRVLWVSESPRIHSGYGRVARELTKRFVTSDKYDLAVLGWEAEVGETESDPAGYLTFAPGSRPWSWERIAQVIDQFAPEVVITSGPLPALHALVEVPSRPFVRWIGHACFEAGPLSEGAAQTMREMDQVVLPSEWCKRLVDEVYPGRLSQRIGLTSSDPKGRPSSETRKPLRSAMIPVAQMSRPKTKRQQAPEALAIPLGVDPSVFRPLSDRDRVRAEAGLSGRFVVGCVARNLFRKQIPILIKAFAGFCRDHPDVFLYLHMDPDDQGWRLLEVLRRYGVADRAAFTRGLAGAAGVNDTTLNMIYNLFDVMVLPTMGEAFGLPLLEAMAAGVPVLATDCSAVPELVGDRGELVKVKDWLTLTWDGAEYAIADGDDLAQRLSRLHADGEARAEYGARGRAFALRMTWDHCASRWMALIDRHLAPSAPVSEEGVVCLRTFTVRG